VKRHQGYKIAIGILCLVIIIQWIFIIALTRPKRVPKPPIRPKVVTIKGRIAIVLDDWGYNLNNLPILEQIKYPLTISVLPNLDYSRTISEGLKRQGYEIILHLPMEPHEKHRLEKNTIMTSMDEGGIKEIVALDLNSVLGASGVSNHMGSMATEDSRTMEIIFKELRQRGLYFLDSFVSSRSVCADLAGKAHVRLAKRDVFLDNYQERTYIRNQVYKLKSRAKIFGQAIGIGHDHKITLEVLKEVMPELEKDGYKFVYVSELAH
jgi:polysaccharide deacetylase 2 family uncharacterized protein YibQ